MSKLESYAIIRKEYIQPVILSFKLIVDGCNCGDDA